MFGVPRGSVLGPLLYILYVAELSNIVMHHLKLHQYADDCQVHISAPVDAADNLVAAERFRVCLDDVDACNLLNGF